MRVWHNICTELDVVEYMVDVLYGIVDYKGEKVLGNHRLLSPLISSKDILEYIDWCDMICDKEIYNRITKNDKDEDWK